MQMLLVGEYLCNWQNIGRADLWELQLVAVRWMVPGTRFSLGRETAKPRHRARRKDLTHLRHPLQERWRGVGHAHGIETERRCRSQDQHFLTASSPGGSLHSRSASDLNRRSRNGFTVATRLDVRAQGREAPPSALTTGVWTDGNHGILTRLRHPLQ